MLTCNETNTVYNCFIVLHWGKTTFFFYLMRLFFVFCFFIEGGVDVHQRKFHPCDEINNANLVPIKASTAGFSITDKSSSVQLPLNFLELLLGALLFTSLKAVHLNK